MRYCIGIGSSPIGYEGFVQPQKGQGEAKLNYISITIVSVTHLMTECIRFVNVPRF